MDAYINTCILVASCKNYYRFSLPKRDCDHNFIQWAKKNSKLFKIFIVNWRGLLQEGAMLQS